MTKYWFISMAIPGECFARENRLRDAPKPENESHASELKKIAVEDITAEVLKLGEDPEANS